MIGVRGTVVAIGSLGRDKEYLFKLTQRIENIQSLNNFQFDKDGIVIAHRQFKIGNGKVIVYIRFIHTICLSFLS